MNTLAKAHIVGCLESMLDGYNQATGKKPLDNHELKTSNARKNLEAALQNLENIAPPLFEQLACLAANGKLDDIKAILPSPDDEYPNETENS